MTAGLLMLGALFSNANATGTALNALTDAQKAKLDGSTYYYVQVATSTPVYLKYVPATTTPAVAAAKIDATVTSIPGTITPDLLWAVKLEKKGNVEFYSFTNKKSGKVLMFDKNGVYTETAADDNLPTEYTLDATHGNLTYGGTGAKFGEVEASGSTFAMTASAAAATGKISIEEISTVEVTAIQLNTVNGDGFILGTTPDFEATPLLKNKLTALVVNSKMYFAKTSTIDFATLGLTDVTTAAAITLDQNSSKKVLAAFDAIEFVKISSTQYGSEAVKTGKGFAYEFVKGSTLYKKDGAAWKAMADDADKAQFTVKFDPSTGATEFSKDLSNLIITQENVEFGTTAASSKVTVRPQILTADSKNYLVTMVADDENPWVAINFNGSSVPHDFFDGKAYSVTVGNTKNNGGAIKNYTGWIFSPSESEIITDPAKKYVYANRPEGQWVIRWGKENVPAANNTKTEKEGFWMYNRENAYTWEDNAGTPNKFNEYKIYLGTTVYLVEGTEDMFCVPEEVMVASGMRTAYADTLKLTEQTLCHSRLGGYAHSEKVGDAFDGVTLASTAYKLGIQNGDFDGIVYVQNQSVHNNTLVVDVKSNEGLSFYLVPVDTVKYGLSERESKDKYTDVFGAAAKDSLFRIEYALQERVTKRFVTYQDNKLMLGESKSQTAENAMKFFLKQTAEGKYVLVLGNSKVYANIGDASLHTTDLYKRDIADEFMLVKADAPKYADILKEVKADSDTTLVNINLYSVQNLVGNSAYMLAAGENDFLVEGVPSAGLKSMGGLAYDSVAFSIAVDTAYVNRAGNTMPLYYLTTKGTARKDSVGPLHKGEKDEFGHPVECTHYAMNDTVAGKYLFAMYDSIIYAKAKDIKKEDYCYHYTNTEHFARLRFVDAVRVVDTVIVASVNPAEKDTLKAGAVSTEVLAARQNEWLGGFEVTDEFGKAVNEHLDVMPSADNFGLFAFEINPANEKEYAIYNPASGLYVAYLNGNVVLAPQASYYTLVTSATEDKNVVANDEINASAISVIAGNGSVTIKGAEGKKVAISNVLGQQIANTVVTSSEATIAVPAGMVVVAVDGEAAVKAIVK